MIWARKQEIGWIEDGVGGTHVLSFVKVYNSEEIGNLLGKFLVSANIGLFWGLVLEICNNMCMVPQMRDPGDVEYLQWYFAVRVWSKEQSNFDFILTVENKE